MKQGAVLVYCPSIEMVFLIGGSTNDGTTRVSTVSSWSPYAPTWTTKSNVPGSNGRWLAAAACDGNGQLHVIGGVGVTSLTEMHVKTNMGAASSSWAISFSTVPDFPASFSARGSGVALTVPSSKHMDILVGPGHGSADADLWRYSAKTSLWRVVNAAVPWYALAARACATCDAFANLR